MLLVQHDPHPTPWRSRECLLSRVEGSRKPRATAPAVVYSNFGESVIDVGAPGGGYETLEKTLTKKKEGDADRVDESDIPGVEWPFPTNLIWNTMDPDTRLGQELGGVEYAYLAGTSMAAPQVTGTVGLVREVAPNASAQLVEKAIEQGAALVRGRNAALGAGRLNCAKTLDAPALNREQ